ncbi:uncharacterized protein LOC134269299, partial [Saccostrea cucullata]|uniref:uncharacterized protein LOC134269299 n=1 Tax=Saccostrea cuccullata TaxID=36930 RepID=UPI002ED337BC
MSYDGFGFVVDSCPLSQEKTTEAATRLGCDEDENRRSRYVCVPNKNLTVLIEFCFTKTIVGIYEKGHCLRSIGKGFLDQISCSGFTEGCPDQYFRSTDLYKYPACLHLNPEERCFIAERSCNASRFVETSTNILGALNMTTDYTSSFNSTITAVNDELLNVGVIAGIGATVSLLFLIVLAIVICRCRRNQ